MNDRSRHELGLKPVIHELLHVRERWATVTNEAMQEAHVAIRIDHRSLEAQGIDREPQPHIPRAAFEMERHGYRSVVADRLREEYQARLQARSERTAGAAADTDSKARAAEPPSLDDIRREARENWLRFKQSQRQSQPESAASAAKDHVQGDDLAH